MAAITLELGSMAWKNIAVVVPSNKHEYETKMLMRIMVFLFHTDLYWIR
jgi:hypothetical protein